MKTKQIKGDPEVVKMVGQKFIEAWQQAEANVFSQNTLIFIKE